jgi:hypothetical protein
LAQHFRNRQQDRTGSRILFPGVALAQFAENMYHFGFRESIALLQLLL